MKTITQIILKHCAGQTPDEILNRIAAANLAISIESPPFMRLVIEGIGRGPRGLPLLSVCHYGEQNGDAMRDPEMTFELFRGNPLANEPDRLTFAPVSYRNDYAGICQEGDRGAVFKRDGRMLIRPQLVRELEVFARQWDKNIKDQGFLDVEAKEIA